MKYRFIVFLLVSLLAWQQTLARQKSAWWRTRLNQHFQTFDGNCSSTSLVGASLRSIVSRAISNKEKGLPSTWGDRAVLFQLKRGEPGALFVMTTCGATGNCRWRLYDSRTRLFLGELEGQFIFAYTSDAAWPMLVTYTHMSACEGELARYEFRGNKYRWTRDDYAVSECGLNDTPMPRRLAKAKRLCEKYGF